MTTTNGAHRPRHKTAAATHRGGSIHQGFFVRESERSAVAHQPPGAAADRDPDQCRRHAAVGHRYRSGDQARRQRRNRQHPALPFRTGIRRRVSHPQRPAGKSQPARDDRMPATALPVRARNHRHRGPQWRLPAAPARSGRFRQSVSAENGDRCSQRRRRRRRVRPQTSSGR